MRKGDLAVPITLPAAALEWISAGDRILLYTHDLSSYDLATEGAPADPQGEAIATHGEELAEGAQAESTPDTATAGRNSAPSLSTRLPANSIGPVRVISAHTLDQGVLGSSTARSAALLVSVRSGDALRLARAAAEGSLWPALMP